MQALAFEGKGFEYFKIWIVNILLTVVTLGIYYPWAKVRNARYFYANSTLEGKNFEYHATGKQLFIGYIISMVLLILYIVIQNVSVVGGFVVLGLLFIAFPWIIWRSMKFNMRVTSFSNVRFSFAGKLSGAYFNFLLLPILFIIAIYAIPAALAYFTMMSGGGSSVKQWMIALGFLIVPALAVFLYSYMKKRNVKYLYNGSRYGQGEFSSDAVVAPFVTILLKTIGLFLLGVAGLFAISGLIIWSMGLGSDLMQLAPAMNDPEARASVVQSPLVIILIAVIYIGFIFVSLLAFAYSYARQREYIYDTTTLDNKISFKSTLRARKLAFVTITNFLLVIFTLGLAMPWAKVRMARLLLGNSQVDTSVGIDGYVTQQQKEQSSLGEQIGDAFDVDVGIAI